MRERTYQTSKEAREVLASENSAVPADASPSRRKDRADGSTLEEEIKRIAVLMASGVSAKDLGKFLNGSAATIARRIEQARARGYLKTTLTYNRELISSEEAARFKLFPLQEQLARALRSEIGNRLVPRITIVPTEEGDPEGSQIAQVGRAAALRLIQLAQMGRMKKVGVAWGGLIAALAREASRLAETSGARISTSIEFIPVCGDLLHPDAKDAYSVAASSLATELARACRGELPADQQLLWSPAYIPWEFLCQESKPHREETRKLLAKFVEALPSYHLILGARERRATQDPPPQIRVVDTILSGVGDVEAAAETDEHHTWFYLTEHLSPEDRDELPVRSVGNLCGQFVARRGPGWESEQAWLDERINQRVFVPSLDDFAYCAGRARTDGTPGPIVLAVGPHKAEVVATVALRGLVTELVIDFALAHRLAVLFNVQ